MLDCLSDAQSVKIGFAAVGPVSERNVSLGLVVDQKLAMRRTISAMSIWAVEIKVELSGGYLKSAKLYKAEIVQAVFSNV